MAVFGFLLATIHIPGVTAASTLAGWAFLSLTLPLCLLRKLQMTLCHWLGVIFLAYAALSLAWSPKPLVGIETLWHWALIGGAFCLGHRLQDLRKTFIGLGLGLAVSVIVGAFQIAGFRPVFSFETIWPSAPGLFYNPNALSETAAIILAGLIVYRLWWLAGVAALALAMGQGRAALVAFLITAIACFVPLRYRFSASIAALLMVLGAFALKDGSAAIMLRWEAIGTAFAGGVPFFGHGVGSFGVETPSAYFDHLHNDFLEVIYEFGIGSIPLFAIFASALFRGGMGRPVLFCFAIVACCSFPVSLPVTAFVAALVAGHMHRARSMAWYYDAFRRRLVHESLGEWGYWSDREGRSTVSFQPAYRHRPGKFLATG